MTGKSVISNWTGRLDQVNYVYGGLLLNDRQVNSIITWYLTFFESTSLDQYK